VIAYLDASALVKRYVTEHRSAETIELSTRAEVVATSLVSRAEVAAAFAKAARSGALSDDEARKAQRTFAEDWLDFARLPVTEAVVARAETLAWDHALRGYDAVQLAAALTWQESVGMDVVVATFDTLLWKAARQEGLNAWPVDLATGGHGDAVPRSDPEQTERGNK
jgi:predicted nucleic acid-binding protein